MYSFLYKNRRYILGLGISWAGLGAYRGVQDYNKRYKKDYQYFLKHKDNGFFKEKEPKYYYVSCFGSSILYLIRYVNPIIFMASVIDELYNVEKMIRGIKDDDDE